MLTLLALHGAGRSETDLAAFCHRIAPRAQALLPRGDRPCGAGYAWVGRSADGGISRAEVLTRAARWRPADPEQPPRSRGRLVLVGYSRGALMALALMHRRPDRYAACILLRPEPLSRHAAFPRLPCTAVLILAGRGDTRRRPDDAARLARQLQAAGARVALCHVPGGHGWSPGDRDARLARAWLSRVVPG
jgi:phospholipase/carboxylesterase